jgi:hypothetical protein
MIVHHIREIAAIQRAFVEQENQTDFEDIVIRRGEVRVAGHIFETCFGCPECGIEISPTETDLYYDMSDLYHRSCYYPAASESLTNEQHACKFYFFLHLE